MSGQQLRSAAGSRPKLPDASAQPRRGLPKLLTVAAAVLPAVVLPAVALADVKPSLTGKVALTGFYYTESDGLDLVKDPSQYPTKIASLSQLGFGELRVTVAGARLLKERIDFRLDARVRLTGNFDYERKFSFDDAVRDLYVDNPAASLGISARGYLGGSEYDVREAYVSIRATPSWQISVGRMFVLEADAMKLDGVRLAHTFNEHWMGSVFAGGYPNPYSRSLLSDYAAPCGAGVSGQLTGLANEPCQTDGLKFGVGFGVGSRYTYDTLWGAVGLVGSVFLGPGDGGPVNADPAANSPMGLPSNAPVTGNLLAPSDALDAPRIFVSWQNSWRPAERVDLMSDVVIDLYGSAGPQPTRIMALSTIRILNQDRLTLRLGYSHMSSLAINMFFSRLLYNRRSGTTLNAQGASAVENNLTVLRTGRDEGRATFDTRIIRRLGAFVEGRVRARALVGGSSNSSVYTDPGFKNNQQVLAGDVSAGVRDTGSYKGIRAGLTYSGIFDFRASNHVINFDVGRDFASERYGVTFNYTLAITKDKTSVDDAQTCNTMEPWINCYGARSGMTHEVGLLGTANPWRTLFFLLDYRFIAMLTDPQDRAVNKFPPLLSHAILLRSEFRW